MSRLHMVSIDPSEVSSSEELHCVLKDALGFLGWYGCNRDAFWDAITGLVENARAPENFRWNMLSKRFSEDARLMQHLTLGVALGH